MFAVMVCAWALALGSFSLLTLRPSKPLNLKRPNTMTKTENFADRCRVHFLNWKPDTSSPHYDFQSPEYRSSKCSLRDADFILRVVSQPIHLGYENCRTYELQIFVDSFTPAQTVEFWAHDIPDAQALATLYILDWLNDRMRGWESKRYIDNKSLQGGDRVTHFPIENVGDAWHPGCEDTAP